MKRILMKKILGLAKKKQESYKKFPHKVQTQRWKPIVCSPMTVILPKKIQKYVFLFVDSGILCIDIDINCRRNFRYW